MAESWPRLAPCLAEGNSSSSPHAATRAEAGGGGLEDVELKNMKEKMTIKDGCIVVTCDDVKDDEDEGGVVWLLSLVGGFE